MVEKKILLIKKRELGDIFSDSFEFLKQEYKPILKLVLTYVLPFLILYGVVQVYVQKNVFGNFNFTDPESIMENIGPFYKNIFLFSLFGIFVQSLLIGTFYSYLEIYIKKGKGNFELSEITPNLFSNGLLALTAGVVTYIIMVFGLALCFLPGIYFANTLSMATMVLIFDKKGLKNALSRSWNLVNIQWWNTLLISIVGIIILWIVSFLLTLPVTFLGTGNLLYTLEQGATEQSQWYWIMTGVVSIITSFLPIILYTFLAMQYFNLVERTKPENS